MAAGANKRLKKKEGNRTVERFVASEVTSQCSDQVPSLGGYFDAINNGLSGTMILNNYSDNTNCKHVVQADSSCEEIQINYQSVAIEPHPLCEFDSFRFGWTRADGFDVTPGRCSCFGEGCFTDLEYYDYGPQNNIGDTDEAMLGPDSFSIKSNSFTFYLKTDNMMDVGHIIFNWECVSQRTPTIM